MLSYLQAHWQELVAQLLVTVVGVYLGYLAGNAQAAFSWKKQVNKDAEDSRLNAIRRLETTRREAEYNYDHALLMRELRLNHDIREIRSEALHLDAAAAALSDTNVFDALDPETHSLLQTYLYTGRLVETLRASYLQLAVQQNYTLPQPLFEKVAQHLESLRYNAAAFAATCLAVNERLLPITAPAYANDPAFQSALKAGEQHLRDLTQGILDGRYERPASPPRLTPSKSP